MHYMYNKNSSHLIALACVLLGASTGFAAPMNPGGPSTVQIGDEPVEVFESFPGYAGSLASDWSSGELLSSDSLPGTPRVASISSAGRAPDVPTAGTASATARDPSPPRAEPPESFSHGAHFTQVGNRPAPQVFIQNPFDDMSSRPWQVAIPDPAVQPPPQNQPAHNPNHVPQMGQQSHMYGQGRGVMPQPAHPSPNGGMYYGQPQPMYGGGAHPQQQQHLYQPFAQYPGQMGQTHFAPNNPYATQQQQPPWNSASIVGSGRVHVVNPRGAPIVPGAIRPGGSVHVVNPVAQTYAQQQLQYAQQLQRQYAQQPQQGQGSAAQPQQQRIQQLHQQMGRNGRIGS